MITVNVWDKTQIGAVEKALRQSSLGFNPVVDGTTTTPAHAAVDGRAPQGADQDRGDTYSETARIAVRGVRRDAMDSSRSWRRPRRSARTRRRAHSDDVQKATDDAIKAVDEALVVKSEEIMQV